MNENTTVLVGNWLRPKKKRRKKKDPAAQQKGYIHAGSLSLWVLITPLLGLSSYLGWVLMDLSQSHMQILDESLSLFWFMMAWHKRMLTENFHMKLISQVNDRITTNCVKLYKDFFCFFFFARSQREGGGPSARGAFDYLNRRSRGVTKPFLFGQRPACRKIPPRAREKRETLNENAHREGVRRRADVIYDR